MNQLSTPANVDLVQLLMRLAGGLALFLLGLNQLTDALQSAAGDRLRTVLEKMTANRFTGIISGVFVTTLTQSSSVTTVLLVGFVSAGLMTLSQTIGVILGAGIASTFTAQIIAFKFTQYSLAFIAVGFAASCISRGKELKQFGLIVLALGLIFFGMAVMGDATEPVRDWQPFLDLMIKLKNPWLGVLVGTVFTAVIQSSGATVGLLIVLAANGLISLDAGIAITFGAKLASLGKPREAHQVAIAHVTIKIIGVALWISFIPQLAEFVRWFSPQYPDLDAAARLAQETPRQIANAHTIFNIVNTLIMVWFVTPYSWLIEKLRPVREHEPDIPIKAKYLDESVLNTPSFALGRLRLETQRLGGYTLRDVDLAMRAVLVSRDADLDQLAHDQGVRSLHMQILNYIRKLAREQLTDSQSRQLESLLRIGDYFVSMDEIARINMVAIGRERIKHGIICGDETKRRLSTLFDRTRRAVQLTKSAVDDNDPQVASKVVKMKSDIERLSLEVMDHLTARLLADSPKRAETFRIESDCVAQAKRFYYYAKRIARIVLADDSGDDSDDQDATGTTTDASKTPGASA